MKIKGAFIEAAEFAIADAFKSIIDPTHIPMTWPKLTFYTVECIKDHIRHIDAGVGGISVPVKAGDIIETQNISIHSLDMQYFKLLRTEER